MTMELIDFIKANRLAIAEAAMKKGVSEDWREQLVNGDIDIIDIKEQRVYNGWEEEFDDEYEKVTGLTVDIVKQYLDDNCPKYVVVGEELASIFITDVEHPEMMSNWMTMNDEAFFGVYYNNKGQAEVFEVNGKKLFITFGIPDPGSC